MPYSCTRPSPGNVRPGSRRPWLRSSAAHRGRRTNFWRPGPRAWRAASPVHPSGRSSGPASTTSSPAVSNGPAHSRAAASSWTTTESSGCATRPTARSGVPRPSSRPGRTARNRQALRDRAPACRGHCATGSSSCRGTSRGITGSAASQASSRAAECSKTAVWSTSTEPTNCWHWSPAPCRTTPPRSSRRRSSPGPSGSPRATPRHGATSRPWDCSSPAPTVCGYPQRRPCSAPTGAKNERSCSKSSSTARRTSQRNSRRSGAA